MLMMKRQLYSLNYLNRLVKVVDISMGSNIEKPKKSTAIVLGDIEVYIPLEDLIDINKEFTNNLQKNLLKKYILELKKIYNDKTLIDACERIERACSNIK